MCSWDCNLEKSWAFWCKGNLQWKTVNFSEQRFVGKNEEFQEPEGGTKKTKLVMKSENRLWPL